MKLDKVDFAILAAIPGDDFVSRESIGRAVKRSGVETVGRAVSYRLRTMEDAGLVERNGDFYSRIDDALNKGGDRE